MKKFLALTLVLCMALAAIPALAETDFTGTWYLVTMGQTAGTFELNADDGRHLVRGWRRRYHYRAGAGSAHDL